MSLDRYRRPRLVVQSSRTTAREAARAMESNQIGTVIVQEDRRVAGIVTDRDLALRMIGYGLDPSTTTLDDIMSVNVATLQVEASPTDALLLMRARNVRRIPLLEGDRVVGIVTLDDLLLDEAAPLDELAKVVRSQLGPGGPVPTRRFDHSRATERRLARAEETYARLVKQVEERTGLGPRPRAAAVLDLVLAALVRRLTPQEATDFVAQLPSMFHDGLLALPTGPDRSITRSTIEADLAELLGMAADRTPPVLDAIGAVIARNVSAGEIEDVLHQLPAEMHTIFRPAA